MDATKIALGLLPGDSTAAITVTIAIVPHKLADCIGKSVPVPANAISEQRLSLSIFDQTIVFSFSEEKYQPLKYSFTEYLRAIGLN